MFVVVAIVCSGVGLYTFGQTQANDVGVRLPIVMYHSIVDDTSKCNDYTVTPQILNSDLEYLKSHGYETVTIQNLLDYIQDGTPLPDKPIMLTADDGYYNNLFYLVPLLEEYDYTAVVSFVGEFTDVTATNDPHIPEYSYCTWEDINEMLDTGTIELGNHTYAMHSNTVRNGCAKLSYESLEDYTYTLTSDVSKLQSEFTTNTGVTPIVFTYPYGSTSRESVSILKSLGFKATFNCYEQPNYITKDLDCLFGLNRYNRSSSYSTEEYMALIGC
jgi:peptidoglycan/xylan/chitin deacetylase (PgdA/CDA1 family)